MTKAPSQEEAREAVDAILKKHKALAKDEVAREELTHSILVYMAKTCQSFKDVGYEAGMNAATDLSIGVMATIAGAGRHQHQSQ